MTAPNDTKCAVLAESFLRDNGIDTPRTIAALASAIQYTIEEYIESENKQRERAE